MAEAEDETSRLFRIRKNVMQMLLDRGYLVSPETEINITRRQFLDKFGAQTGSRFNREGLNFIKSKSDDTADQIYVFFPSAVKVGAADMKYVISQMNAENIKRAIVIARQNMTPQARSVLEGMQTFRIEIFLEAELLVNITDHELVPEHRVLTNAEKKKLLEKYSLKETQLPRMLVADPIARYYGLKRGQVVKIIRPSPTAGKYVTYRLVG